MNYFTSISAPASSNFFLRSSAVVQNLTDKRAGWTDAQIAQNRERGLPGLLSDWNFNAATFSPSNWIRGWRETTNGEQAFDPAIDHQLQKSLDPQTYSLAKEIASGYSSAHILGNASGQDKINLTQAMNSPEVKKAVDQFNAGLFVDKLVPSRLRHPYGSSSGGFQHLRQEDHSRRLPAQVTLIANA